MSRSGYDDWNGTNSELELYRGNVERSIRGKRGQALLRDLLAALDAMPDKRLIGGALEDGPDVCALGAVGRRRQIDLSRFDDCLPEDIARAFDIAACLAAECAYVNDEAGPYRETPEQRWARVRRWVVENITPGPGEAVIV